MTQIYPGLALLLLRWWRLESESERPPDDQKSPLPLLELPGSDTHCLGTMRVTPRFLLFYLLNRFCTGHREKHTLGGPLAGNDGVGVDLIMMLDMFVDQFVSAINKRTNITNRLVIIYN